MLTRSLVEFGRKLQFYDALLYFQLVNLVDFFVILPHVVSVFIRQLADLKVFSKAGQMMRLVRLLVRDIRILRVLKLLRYFVGIQSLLCTLRQVSF